MQKKFFILSFVAFGLLNGCSSEQATETTASEKAQDTNVVQLSPAQLQNASIQTGKAERRAISSVIQVNGVMEAPPKNIFSVSVPLGGYLKKTDLLPGMHLKKGQLMAELEGQSYIDLQQDYLTAKARLAFLEKEYSRQRELNQSKASSDKVFQQTKAEYESQQVLLKALAEKLRMVGVNPYQLTQNTLSRTLRLYSPINGFVTKVNVNIGKYVVPTDVLFELVDPHDLHLRLTVFEKDLDKLETGQRVTAYRANQPGQKYPAEIIYIGKNVADDRAVEVHCHLKGKHQELVPGMFMNAEIQTEPQQVYSLPDDAIVRFGDKQYVFTVRDKGTFEMVAAQTGISDQGYTALVAGQGLRPETQTYVTQGAYTLLMKLKNKEEE